MGVVRFAAGSADGNRASMWRLWTNPKGDVYLAQRALASRLKVSLHVSGLYRVAFIQEHPGGDNLDRAFLKWQRIDNMGPGVSRVLSLPVFSADALVPCSGDSKTLKAVWKPPPRDDQLGSFTVILGPPCPDSIWPGQRALGTEVVHRETLGTTGETLWVLWHVEPLTDDHRAARENLRQRIVSTMPQSGETYTAFGIDLRDQALRAIGMGDTDGCCRLWDAPFSLGLD